MALIQMRTLPHLLRSPKLLNPATLPPFPSTPTQSSHGHKVTETLWNQQMSLVEMGGGPGTVPLPHHQPRPRASHHEGFCISSLTSLSPPLLKLSLATNSPLAEKEESMRESPNHLQHTSGPNQTNSQLIVIVIYIQGCPRRERLVQITDHKTLQNSSQERRTPTFRGRYHHLSKSQHQEVECYHSKSLHLQHTRTGKPQPHKTTE